MSEASTTALLAAAREDLARGWSVRAGTRLRQAAQAGDPQAALELVQALLSGRIPGGLREARKRLEALDAPAPEAAMLRAALRYAGLGGAVEPEAALADLTRAADAGGADAAIELALVALEAGDGGARQARAHLENAAETSPLAARLLELFTAEQEKATTRPALAAVRASAQTLASTPRIIRFEGAFTALECAWLRENARERLAPALIADPVTGKARANPVRTSESMYFGPDAPGVFARRFAARMARLAGHDPACAEPLTVLRYSPGQEYKPHHDGLGAAGLARDPLAAAGERVTTVLAWLNVPEAGGATLFPRLDLRIEPTMGEAIAFDNLDASGSPAARSLHAGEPVEAGEKWLASLWIRERSVKLGY